MKITQRKFKPLFIVMGLLTVLAGGFFAQPANAASQNYQVQYSNTAEATVQNITVTPDGNSINVQFDYSLRGTATSATIDAALNDQQSFNQTDITGPGHFNQTLTDLPDGSYTVWIIISGNTDYELRQSTPCGGSSNQPLTITLPSTTSTTPTNSNNYGWTNYKAFTHYISFWTSKLIRH